MPRRSMPSTSSSCCASSSHRLLVERRLLAAQGAEGLHLGLVGQVGDDALVGLQAPQDVGAHQIAQRAVGVVRPLGEPLDEARRTAWTIPSRPGLMKSKIDQRSPSRFSMGVPVSAMRASARSCLTGLVCLAPGFLMACASSSTTSRHGVLRQPGRPRQEAVAGDDQIDVRQIARAHRSSASRPVCADGWSDDRLQARCESLDLRGPVGEQRGRAPPAGSACGRSSALLLQHQQQRQDLDGLAEPHVVGETGAEPQAGQQIEPFARRPADRAAACPGATAGIDPREPSRMRASRARSPPAMVRPRSGSSRRSASAVLSSAMRGAGQQPHGLAEGQAIGGGARSIASNCSSVRLSRSRSISTHLPRMKARPSDCASSCLISARRKLLAVERHLHAGSRAARPSRAARAPCRRPSPSPAGVRDGSCASLPASAR